MRKHIPNMITCCNLICGCIATGHAFVARGSQSEVLLAFTFILLGATFDFFDGFTARLLHVSSPTGKELDSLADVITFGLAPATLAYSTLLGVLPAGHGRWAGLAFVMAAFSALRLAKFNIDERQTMGFLGLPTPANALGWGSVALLLTEHHHFVAQHTEVFIVLTAVALLASCWLLVSEVPMFALKFHDFTWQSNSLRYSFLLLAAIIIGILHLAAFAIIIPLYVLISVCKAMRE